MKPIVESHNQLVDENQLRSWTGYSRQSDISRFLTMNGILFMRGRHNSVVTTVTAVNNAMNSDSTKKIEFE